MSLTDTSRDCTDPNSHLHEYVRTPTLRARGDLCVWRCARDPDSRQRVLNVFKSTTHEPRVTSEVADLCNISHLSARFFCVCLKCVILERALCVMKSRLAVGWTGPDWTDSARAHRSLPVKLTPRSSIRSQAPRCLRWRLRPVAFPIHQPGRGELSAWQHGGTGA